MRILVTGASGLLGLNFCLNMAETHDITGVTHDHALRDVPFRCVQADLTNSGVFAKLISDFRPDLVLHCAAMANVDACEKNPEVAMRINAEVPGELAEVCRGKRIRFVHISTDAVFDGRKGNYSEEDEPHPLSVYAASKLAGEKKVQEKDPGALVARVNFYGFSLSGSRSLAEFFLENLVAAKSVNGFVDVMFCPLYAPDLAVILMQMVQKELNGLFHVVSPECLSKYSFGVSIAKKFGFDPALIKPISVMEGGLAARRSPRLDLNTEKLQGEKIDPPGQPQGLDHFYQDRQAGLPEKIKSFAAM
jgi:dTDP-4-dehydrorhamnose reductase